MERDGQIESAFAQLRQFDETRNGGNGDGLDAQLRVSSM